MSDLATLRTASELAAEKPHGTRIKYMSGCKCPLCKQANSRYERERQQARHRGEWNGIIDATPVRAHLRRLQRAGIGRRSIQAASDIPSSSIAAILTGRKPRIRAHTARRLLNVTVDARADHATVSGKRTWHLIRQLLHEGYTKRRLALLLGYKHPAIQFRRNRVLAKTALRVERLFQQLMV